MDIVLFTAVLGAVVGVILAVTGAGGGILAVPLLVFGLHLTISQAAPVGLLAVAIASGLGAALGSRDGLVRYRAALFIGCIGMLLAPVGLAAARHTPDAPLTVAFACVLLYAAWRIVRRSMAPDGPESDRRPAPPCVVDQSRDDCTGPFDALASSPRPE